MNHENGDETLRVVLTSDVDNRLEIGTQATRDRLNTLLEQGRLRSLRVGSCKVWWLSEPTEDDDLTAIDDDPLFSF